MTFDVASICTNIPHTFGLEALDCWIENHPESLHGRFNKEFVLECAKFILQNNNMNLNNEFYNQIKGAAMGTIFAPTYATLLMGYFEIASALFPVNILTSEVALKLWINVQITLI